jgi:hypothetical protein
MASVMFPDFLGAIGKASAIEANQAQRDWMDEDRAAKKAAGALVPQALGGDREALNRIGSMHPDTAMKIAPLLERMDAGRRAKVKEESDYITQSGMAILSAPPEQQPQLYARVRAEAEASGRNVSNWPTTYDPGWVKFNVDKARPFADYFSNQGGGFDLVPSGGGGAAPPATGDMLSRTKQVIGGMESSNRYDAVGPDTGGGKKALGKYQVMDFNVGPWTQEALGRALTPEQFLASPQAQEAVADFKLGQYIKQFGSPEAAARAWFAGAGGMNNAGAKDVLGTSVQGYGQKFAQAFGPGATGGAQPPGIAQGDTAPPADASGNPIPTSDGGSVPREVMRMITPNLPPGTSLGRDRKTGLFKVQEGNFVVYDSNRNPVGLIPIPKPKEPETGPFGNSTEGRGLNILVQEGRLTRQQAAELAAGKTVTDPETKQVIFMTPSGIFGQKPGQAPQPIAGPSPGMAAPAPMPSAGSPAGVPAPAAPAVTVPANPGALPLTGTQSKGQPSATEMAKLRAARSEVQKITEAAEKFRTEWKKASVAEKARATLGGTTPLNSAYNNFALLLKGEAGYNLGVLNGPDLEVIRRAIPDPSTLRGNIATLDSDMDSAVDQVNTLLRNGIKAQEEQLNITPPQGAQGKQTAKPGTYLGPDNSPISWSEIEDTAKKRGITTDEVVNRLGLKPTGMQ